MGLRLDKYLKVSRLIKRRSLAKEAADRGRILVNSKVAKAATDVQVGDVLELNFGSRCHVVEVVDLKDSIRANEASSLYRVIRTDRSKAKLGDDELKNPE